MKLKTLFLLLALSPFALLAENDIQSALHNPVAFFSEDNEPLKAVLQSLGRAHGISIVTDEDVEGMVQVEMNNTTVKGVLDAILRPGGYFYEIQDGWISVSRFKTVLYTFDYPQITRSGSSSSTISMGGKSSNGSGQMNSSGSGAASGGGSGGGSGNGDTAQIQIQQKTASDFWQSVETQIKSMLGKDETFVINQFSGIVQVKGSAETHRNVANFIYQVNDRIGAQVEILAKIVEVRLTNQKKLGIDWQAAEFSIGNNNQVHVGSPVVPPAGTTADGSSNAIQGLSGVTNLLKNASGIAFSPDTFAGTIGAGKVDVVIRALEEQGDVKVTSQPRLRLLNNQTGYIKDSTDQAFFSKTSSVTINAGGSSYGGPTTEVQYQTQTVSIGTVLPVTAQISSDNEVTLDVTPALTRLITTDMSPDGSQTAPRLEVKQTSTIIRVRSGETAVIGGLITDSASESHRAVPLLSKIPLLGRAFKSDGTATERTELVIFLTPTVITRPGKITQLVTPPAVAALTAAP